MNDQSHPPVSHLFACIACWAVEQGMPSRSFWEGETDEWNVTINATQEMRDGISPMHIHLQHKTYMAFAVLNARGGAITGPSEDEVIAHFNGLLNAPVEAVA